MQGGVCCRGRRSQQPLNLGLVKADGSSGVARSQENLDRPCSGYSSQKIQQDPGALSLQALICEANLALGASELSWGHCEPSPAGPGQQATVPGHLLYSHRTLGTTAFSLHPLCSLGPNPGLSPLTCLCLQASLSPM